MSHPCSRSSCPEWYRGECFGGGCDTNPMPEDDDDNENETEDEAEYENAGNYGNCSCYR